MLKRNDYLQHLRIAGNPICHLNKMREKIIPMAGSLQMLDAEAITPIQRQFLEVNSFFLLSLSLALFLSISLYTYTYVYIYLSIYRYVYAYIYAYTHASLKISFSLFTNIDR